MSRIVLDTMPSVTRQGAGRKASIVPELLPEIMAANGSFIVDGPHKQSTASNRANKLKAFAVEGGSLVAKTRTDLGNGTVADEGQAFVVVAFVADKPKRTRRAAAPVSAVEAS